MVPTAVEGTSSSPHLGRVVAGRRHIPRRNLMDSRISKLVAAGAALSALAGATAAAAAGPPPPVAHSGAPVQLVASGLGTVTSFAFGDGTVFEGDGGSNQAGPPNGGVFALGHGTGTRLAGSPNFVPGLAWHGGKLYVSGGTV